jgi:hypothetical protein
MYSFQRFLTLVLSSPELVYSQELFEFLSLGEAEFAEAKKVSYFLTEEIFLFAQSHSGGEEYQHN